MKKIGRFLASMKFAVILLVVLALACTAGSFITQGQTYEWYAQVYNERIAALIVALSLDDAFHSWWFILITGFLCLNLLLCNVLRLPQLLRRSKAHAKPESMLRILDAMIYRDQGAKAEDSEGLPLQETSETSAGELPDKKPASVQLPGRYASGSENDPLPVFSRLHMGKPRSGQTDSGRPVLFSARNTAGFWGAWVCHLGVLLLIAGFGLGQMTKKEYTVFGVPGQTKDIGDTGYQLHIDDFQVSLREDDTVEQYTADITVSGPEESDASEHAQISVNSPASMYGMKFYQNSTGWAAKVTVEKEDEPLQEEVICAGEFLPVADKPDLVIYLNAFYPDLVRDESGMPGTASGRLNNPAYLYTVYYQGSVIGMNVLLQEEEITIDEYTVRFSEPQSYTLIQIKKDSFTWLALIGGLITMIGLLTALYLMPERVLAVQQEDGSWMILGESRKGGAIYRRRFENALRETGGEIRER